MDRQRDLNLSMTDANFTVLPVWECHPVPCNCLTCDPGQPRATTGANLPHNALYIHLRDSDPAPQGYVKVRRL